MIVGKLQIKTYFFVCCFSLLITQCPISRLMWNKKVIDCTYNLYNPKTVMDLGMRVLRLKVLGLRVLFWVSAVGIELTSIWKFGLYFNSSVTAAVPTWAQYVLVYISFCLSFPGQRGSGWSDVLALLPAHCWPTDHHGDKGAQPQSHGHHRSLRFETLCGRVHGKSLPKG